MSGRHFSAKAFRGEMLFYTRLMGMQKLAVLHAELYPIAGNAEVASAARGAEGWFVREQMLSRSLRRWTQAGVHLGSRAKGLLLVQISKTVHSPTNRLFKRDLPCYFWRKSNQNVGLDTPAG